MASEGADMDLEGRAVDELVADADLGWPGDGSEDSDVA